MTAVNGAVVWAAKYSSFGEATVEIGTVENNLRFPGQYYDAETGLYYNLNRFYDPQLGRYLRADPIRLRSGINLFTYAKNNPLAYYDPLGLEEEKGGCGPGPIGDWFVPDKPGGYDFGGCCNDHDACYKGKMGCDIKQPGCDEDFKKCMDKKCSEYNDIGVNKHNEQYPERPYHGQSRSECERTAKLYHWAVSGKTGAGRLEKAREDPSSPCYKGPNPKDNVVYNASPSPATGY